MAEKFLGRRLTQEEMAQAVTTNLTDYDTAKKYFEEMKKGNKDTYTKGSADKKTKDEETSYKGYHISKGQHAKVKDKESSPTDIECPKCGTSVGSDYKETPAGISFVCPKCGKQYIKYQSSKDTYTKGSADRKTKDVRYPNAEESQKYQQLIGVKQGDPKEREALEKYYGKKIPITQVYNYRMFLFENNIFKDGKSKDKYTGDPLTKKGNKILKAMRERYGKKKGESVFYASKNKGTITGVDGKVKDSEVIKEFQGGQIKKNDQGKFEIWFNERNEPQSTYSSLRDAEKMADFFSGKRRGSAGRLRKGLGLDKKTKDEVVQMQCNECGKRFKKNITSSTVEVKCPACGGYDTDVDEPRTKVIKR